MRSIVTTSTLNSLIGEVISGLIPWDWDLDMVIDSQLNWHWKDEDEYQAGIQEGGIQADWVMGIEKAKADVFDRIRNRTRPLDGSWLNWKPDPSWGPPHLPKGWEHICA